jgi:flagellar basal body-associated protein FliL
MVERLVQFGGKMKKAVIVISIVPLLAVLFVGYLAYSEIQRNQNNTEPITPQPPLPNIIPGAQNVTGTAKGSEAVSIALANSEVKQYTDKGYNCTAYSNGNSAF